MQKSVQSYRIVALWAMLLLLSGLAMIFGGDDLAWVDFAKGGHRDDIAQFIIWEVRLPAVLTAILVGGGLAVVGVLLQTFFNNPLAGPSTIGISAGASLGVAAVTLSSGLALQGQLSPWGIGWRVLGAFAGGGGVMLLLLLISMRLSNKIAVLLVGVLLGQFIFALIGFWQYFSSAEAIREFLFWSLGSLHGVTLAQVPWVSLAIIVAMGGMVVLSPWFDKLLLGEEMLGANAFKHPKSLFGIALCALITGVATAFCGPIAFVGIIVPHLSRMLSGTALHGTNILYAFLLGAQSLLLCLIIANQLIDGTTLPINIIVSLLGAPVIVVLLLRGT